MGRTIGERHEYFVGDVFALAYVVGGVPFESDVIEGISRGRAYDSELPEGTLDEPCVLFGETWHPVRLIDGARLEQSAKQDELCLVMEVAA